MLSTLLFKLINFISIIFNLIVLGFSILLTKIFFSLKFIKLSKNYWIIVNNLLLSKEKIINIHRKVIYLLKRLYNLILIIFITICIYLSILYLLNIFNINFFLSCNRVLLLLFLYITISIYLTNNSFLERYLDLISFDLDRHYNFRLQNWDEYYLELIPPNFVEDDIPEAEFNDVLLRETKINKSYDSFLLYVTNKGKSNLRSDIYKDLSNGKQLAKQFYLFERWTFLSNTILDRFYQTRKFKSLNLISSQNNYVFFKKNKFLILNNEFDIYSKLFKYKGIGNINKFLIVQNLFDLKKFMLNNFVLDVSLSDNLIYNLLYFKLPTTGIKPKPSYSFIGSSKTLYNLKINSFIDDLSIVDKNLLIERSINSNYLNYILGGNFNLKTVAYSDDLSNFIGYNFNYNFLKSDISVAKVSNFKLNFKFIKISRLKRKNLKISTEINFNKEFFFFFSLYKHNFALSESEEILVYESVFCDSKHWLFLQSNFSPNFLSFLLDRVFQILLKRIHDNKFDYILLNQIFKDSLNFLKFQFVPNNLKIKFKKVLSKTLFILFSTSIKNRNFIIDYPSRFFYAYYQTFLPEQTNFVPLKSDSIYYFAIGHYFLFNDLSILFPNQTFSHYTVCVKKNNSKRVQKNERLLNLYFYLNSYVANFYFRHKIIPDLNTLSSSHVKIINKFTLKKRKRRRFYRSNLKPFYLKYLLKIEQSIYFLLFGLSFFLNDRKINEVIKIKSKLNIRYYFSNIKKDLLDFKNKDLFFFPFLNTFNKISTDNNFIKNLLLHNQRVLSLDTHKTISLLLNYKLVKYLNLKQKNNFSIELLLFLQSNERLIDRDLDYRFNNLEIKLYNSYIYKNSFIKNILNSNSKLKIYNLNEFKYFITFYFSNYFYNYLDSQQFLDEVGLDLNLFDFEVLITLGNRIWLSTFRTPIAEYNRYKSSLLESYTTGYLLPDPENNIVDLNFLNIYSSYYNVHSNKVTSIIVYIDAWLKSQFNKKSHNLYNDYTLYFQSVILFWLICRWKSLFDEDFTAPVIDYIDELLAYDDYTDSFKNYAAEALSSYNASTSHSDSYNGQSRGIFENYLSSVVYKVPLEESQAIQDNTYLGDRFDQSTLRFKPSSGEEDEINKVFYYLDEFRFYIDDVDGFLTDFFRNDSKYVEKNLKNLLKWNLYSNLNNPLYFLNKDIYLFLNFKNKINSRLLRRNKIIYIPKRLNRLSNRFNSWKIFSENNYLFKNLNFFFNNYEKTFLKEYNINKKKVNRYDDFAYLKKKIFSFDRLSERSIDAADVISETDTLIEETEATVMEEGFNQKLRDVESLNERAVNLEDFADMYFRVLTNVKLHTRQFFFYNLLEQKKKNLTDHRYFLPYSNLNKNFLLPIFKNVTQYGNDLNEFYSDSIQYLPDYVNFINNLPASVRKKFLNNSPEFYKLIFDNIYIFTSDPFINNYKNKWYNYLYNNPYWQTSLKLQNNYYMSVADSILLKDYLLETFLFSLHYSKELEDFFNYESEEFYARFNTNPNNFSNDEEEEEATQYLNMNLDKPQVSIFALQSALNILNNKQISYNFLTTYRDLLNRSPISDYYIISLLFNFKLKGYVEDIVIRKPWFFQESLFHSLSTIIRTNKSNKQKLFLNDTFSDIFSILKKNPETNPSDFYYSRKFYNDNNKYFLKKNFRKFNQSTYKKIANNSLFNLANQFIENRYQYSDRLFENAPNYYLNQRFDSLMSDISAFEIDSNDIWFDNQEYLNPEIIRLLFPGLRSWTPMVRSILNIPQGTPPLFIFDFYNVNLEKLNYKLKNGKFLYPSRFRDYFEDEDYLDHVQIPLEEGSMAHIYFGPIIIYLVDWGVYFLSKITKYFNMLKLINILRSNSGSGDFSTRSNIYRNSLLNSYSTQLNNNNFFKRNYFYRKQDFIATSKIFKFIENFNIFNMDLNVRSLVTHLDLKLYNYFNFYKKYLNIFFNSYLFNNYFNFISIISFLLLAHYTIWYPFMYLNSILRDWINYPKGKIEDALHSEDHIPEPTGPKYVKLNDSGHIYYTSEPFISLLDASISLFNDDLDTAFENNMLDHISFTKNSEHDLINYASNLILNLSNELIYLNNIQLPGYKFTYNILDLIKLVSYEYRISKFSEPLPFYRSVFLEFLHIFLGSRYKSNHFDKYFQYTFSKNKNLEKLVTFDNGTIDNLNSHDKLIYEQYLINKTLIDEHKLDSNLLNSTYFESSNSYKRNPLILNHLPNKIIWFSNKLLINSLSLLKFSANSLVSNDFYNLMLHSEKTNSNFLNNSNFLLHISDYSSWFFLSKNNLLDMQYRPGERLFPFYNRFKRYTNDFNRVDNFNGHLVKLVKEFQLKFNESNFDLTNKLKKITPTDLLFVHPLNNEGIISYELLLTVLFNLKSYFSEILINQDLNDYEEILLDFHNLEYNEYYTKPFLKNFQKLNLYFQDWLLLIEETKEWLIFLEEDRLIKLKPFSKHQFYEYDPKVVFAYRRYASRRLFYERFYKRAFNKLKVIINPKNRFQFSTYWIVPNEPYYRYIEEPMFPDNNIRFNIFFNRVPLQSLFEYNNIYKKLLFNKKTNIELRNEMFCQALNLQFISDDVCHDIYNILIPEGRAINKRLSMQSSLQLYSYLNLNLNLKLNRNLFNISKYYFYLNLNTLHINNLNTFKIRCSKYFKSFVKFIILLCLLLIFLL